MNNNSALAPGSHIEGFEIKSVLGAGAFGITYKAWETILAREVAIKEYFPTDHAVRFNDGITVAPTENSQAKAIYHYGLDRFIEEARTIAKFSHPNIVNVHRFFEANATAYMVMQYESGQSLYQMLAINNPPLTESRLVSIFAALLAGLRVMHADDFLHRDIKPENIYIREDESPVLLDFGTSRLASKTNNRPLTQILTPGYAPVEQSEADGDQGPWTDLYALGATLYRCVTGQEPIDANRRFAAVQNNRPDVMPAAVNTASRAYSDELLSIIDWLLQIEPKNRPQSADEVYERLSGLMESEDSMRIPRQTLSPKTEVLAPSPAAVVPEKPVTVETALATNSKKPAWLIYTAAAALVAIAAIGIGLFISQDGPTEKDYDNLTSTVDEALNPSSSADAQNDNRTADTQDIALPQKLSRIEALTAKAEAGDSTAQLNLAWTYASGQDVTKNEKQALKWYQESAAQGNVIAQITLGDFYLNGKGTEPSVNDAVKWYEKAAEQGNPIGQYNLAWVSANRNDGQKSLETAFKLYTLSSNQGYAKAKTKLALMYLSGKAIARDEQKALVLLRDAAKQGDKDAIKLVGEKGLL